MKWYLLPSLMESMKNVSLSSSIKEFDPLVEFIGREHEEQVIGFLAAAKIVATNPDDSLSQFIQDGGLTRMLAGQKAAEPVEQVLECPTCKAIIFNV